VAFNLLLCVFSLGEAIAAVNRAIFSGLEGNLAFCTAVCANCIIEGLSASGSSLACVTASFASLGLILEALFCIEFLLTGGEHKLVAAIFACKCLVFVHLSFPLSWILFLNPAQELRKPAKPMGIQL
jgi:hypothetical protein